MRSLVLGLLFFGILLNSLPAGAQEESLSSFGNTSGVTREDLLYLLSEETGGEPLMAQLFLTCMDQEERYQLVKQLTDTLVLERAARISGLDLREDLRLQIRWGRANLLARAYAEKLAERWDLSEEALREYYERHQERYVRNLELSLLAFFYATEEEARSALMASLGANSFGSLASSGFSRRVPLGWVSSLDVSPEYAGAFLSSDSAKSVLGPFESPRGEYVLLFVENRLDSRKLSFEEARGALREDLEMELLEEELRELRRRFNVRIHGEKIRELQPYEF